MSGFLQRLGLGRRPPPPIDAPRLEALDPGAPVLVIGDVHGCYPQLQRLLDRIEAEHPGTEIICVGDYVDRGDQSKEVLQLLQARQTQSPDRFHCLMGNHEAMLMDFLAKPEAHGDRWLRYGGLQTLASYGVSAGLGPDKDLAGIRDALSQSMGPDVIAWLQDRPLQLQRGNVAIVHTAADPEAPLDAQSRDVLLWGHPAFKKHPRADGQWVVHGHTIVDEASAEMGRVAVDTGAYATGRLTAALLQPGQVRFLTS